MGANRRKGRLAERLYSQNLIPSLQTAGKFHITLSCVASVACG